MVTPSQHRFSMQRHAKKKLKSTCNRRFRCYLAGSFQTTNLLGGTPEGNRYEGKLTLTRDALIVNSNSHTFPVLTGGGLGWSDGRLFHWQMFRGRDGQHQGCSPRRGGQQWKCWCDNGRVLACWRAVCFDWVCGKKHTPDTAYVGSFPMEGVTLLHVEFFSQQ